MKKVLLSSALGLTFFASTAIAASGANPYESHCALTLAEAGTLMKTDCSIRWTDPKTNKMYCFGTEDAKSKFSANSSKYIPSADSRYKVAIKEQDKWDAEMRGSINPSVDVMEEDAGLEFADDMLVEEDSEASPE